jgi:LPXTG-motif cell wall-anchored protein
VHNADYPAGAVRGQLAYQALPDTGVSESMPMLLGGALVALLAGVGMRRTVRA